MKTFWNIDKNLTALNEWQPNCWVQVTCPTDEDQRLLEEEFKIPDYFLSDISDTDERARYEYDDGHALDLGQRGGEFADRLLAIARSARGTPDLCES